MWHLHLGKPERCLEGSESRATLARRAMRETGTILCESNLPPELCATRLAEAAQARAEAAERGG